MPVECITDLYMNDTDEIRSALKRYRRQARTAPDSVPIDLVLDALECPEPSVQERAITVLYVLSKTNPDRLNDDIPQVADLLENDRSTVRTKATLTLSNVAEESPTVVKPHVDDVIERLDDRSSSTRRTAIETVRRISDADPSAVVRAVPQMAQLLSADTEETRRDAAVVLETLSIDHPDAVFGSIESLVALLQDPYRTPTDLNYRSTAAADRSRAAAQTRGYRSLVSDATGQESNVRAREAAARVIAKLARADPPAATELLEPHLPRLFDRLEDANPAIRASVASSLAYVAQERPEAVRPAEEPLIEMLDGPIAVSSAAIWALRYVDTNRSREALEKTADRADAPLAVQKTARTALDDDDDDIDSRVVPSHCTEPNGKRESDRHPK